MSINANSITFAVRSVCQILQAGTIQFGWTIYQISPIWENSEPSICGNVMLGKEEFQEGLHSMLKKGKDYSAVCLLDIEFLGILSNV